MGHVPHKSPSHPTSTTTRMPLDTLLPTPPPLLLYRRLAAVPHGGVSRCPLIPVPYMAFPDSPCSIGTLLPFGSQVAAAIDPSTRGLEDRAAIAIYFGRDPYSCDASYVRFCGVFGALRSVTTIALLALPQAHLSQHQAMAARQKLHQASLTLTSILCLQPR